MVRIEEIPGIGSVNAKKLSDIGIKTTEDLLKAGVSLKSRAELGKRTGIDPKLILEWVKASTRMPK
jgi:nucleotidyltransferase/DNA polymerase involved in DNA repair